MANRLADETSPYLRQHADNPVDWQPWGDEAFEQARSTDRPVLLSIGYSACHWCHVMAHESFEDADTAAIMNDRFVNVKVVREQRPDVDAVYMQATQAMTGHGGWPMTVFLTPDGQPFYCGTYFPNQRRHGMPAFREVLHAIDDLWRNRRDELEQQARTLTEHLQRSALGDGDRAERPLPDTSVLESAVRNLLADHDGRLGGFGSAPKFPQPMAVDVLLRSGSADAVAAASFTLDAMASGGMYDHVGGGFSRYSVDAGWLVPHFEKMLYDQALLARAYLHGWQVTGSAMHRQILNETVGYVLRDLRHPAGGLFSAEDAGSEGEEGRFYTWTLDELTELLGDGDELQTAVEWYGVTATGNFEGRNILNRLHARGELRRPADVEHVHGRLLLARGDRIRPGLDDKVLTEWNALMIATLAEAGAATGEGEWLDAAGAAGEFLLDKLRRPDGRWLRSWQDGGGQDGQAGGRATTLAFAADYAALVDAFTRLYEATGRARWITEAVDAAETLLGLFWDDEDGGVFTVGHDGEQLVARQKDLLDNAIPSANSLTAVGLLRLGALTGVDRYTHRAEAILRLLGEAAGTHPLALANLLAAVALDVGGIDEIVVTGDRPDLVAAVRSAWRPGAVLAWGERFESPLWHDRPDAGLRGPNAMQGRAYVCRDYVCDAPADSADALLRTLSTDGRSAPVRRQRTSGVRA
ncbi:MAG: thioredoxin domain-containing protein [Acidimicrobiales bacterium]